MKKLRNQLVVLMGINLIIAYACKWRIGNKVAVITNSVAILAAVIYELVKKGKE